MGVKRRGVNTYLVQLHWNQNHLVVVFKATKTITNNPDVVLDLPHDFDVGLECKALNLEREKYHLDWGIVSASVLEESGKDVISAGSGLPLRPFPRPNTNHILEYT